MQLVERNEGERENPTHSALDEVAHNASDIKPNSSILVDKASNIAARAHQVLAPVFVARVRLPSNPYLDIPIAIALLHAPKLRHLADNMRLVRGRRARNRTGASTALLVLVVMLDGG
jgi:hypothetical protein